MKLKWDRSRWNWHERLVRFDRRGNCWLPWHWILNGNCDSARRWFGWTV